MYYTDEPVRKDATYWIVTFWFALGTVATFLVSSAMWMVATVSQLRDRFSK